MYGFIYETTCLVTGKKYIGQHKCKGSPSDPEDSWYLGSGTLLKEDISKYGYNEFRRVILRVCNSQSELDESEKEFISKYNATEDPMYYNIAQGGGGSWFTDKGRQRMSESAKSKFRDPEKRSKYLHPHRVTPAVLESARQRGISKRGKPIEDPEITRLRMTGSGNPQYGKPRTDEFKSMIRDRLTGIVRDDHHKKATSEANIGMRFINNGCVTKRVRGSVLEQYLSEGWVLGQAKRRS